MMVMTSECQQENKLTNRKKQGNNYMLLCNSKVERGRKLSSSSSFKMKLQQLVLLLLYIIPLPSNQVPANKQHPQLIPVTTRQQLRSSANDQNNLQAQVFEEFEQITPLPLSSTSSLQTQHPDAPKLIPLSALDRYQEGADLRLFCSASSPQSGGRLQFEWRKNQAEQLSSSSNDLQLQNQQMALPVPVGTQQTGKRHLSINLMDDSSSVLRINHLEAEDSGNYTCLVRNQHGFDSSTVRVNVNVRLKWIKEPPSEVQVRAGKSVQLECDASGQPAPLISWTSLADHQTIHSKIMRIDRTQVNDSGLYECKATSIGGGQQHSGMMYESVHNHNALKGEQLRKVVKLTVNGK